MDIVRPVASARHFRLISLESARFRESEPRRYRRSVAVGRRLSLLNCERGQYKCRVGNIIPVAVQMGTERQRRTRPLNSVAGNRCHGRRACPVIRLAADWCGAFASRCRHCCLIAVARRAGARLAPCGRFSAVPSERLLGYGLCRSPMERGSLPCRPVLATTARWCAGMTDAVSSAADAAKEKGAERLFAPRAGQSEIFPRLENSRRRFNSQTLILRVWS